MGNGESQRRGRKRVRRRWGRNGRGRCSTILGWMEDLHFVESLLEIVSVLLSSPSLGRIYEFGGLSNQAVLDREIRKSANNIPKKNRTSLARHKSNSV